MVEVKTRDQVDAPFSCLSPSLHCEIDGVTSTPTVTPNSGGRSDPEPQRKCWAALPAQVLRVVSR